MEQALLIHHKENFSQASDTPFSAPEVIDRLGLSADTEYSQLFRMVNTTELTHWNNNIATEFLQRLLPIKMILHKSIQISILTQLNKVSAYGVKQPIHLLVVAGCHYIKFDYKK